jgi:hypothetical protein
MSVQLAFWDGGYEFVVFREDEMCDFLDVRGNGRGEEHSLSVCARFVWQTPNDVFECIHKPHVE